MNHGRRARRAAQLARTPPTTIGKRFITLLAMRRMQRRRISVCAAITAQTKWLEVKSLCYRRRAAVNPS